MSKKQNPDTVQKAISEYNRYRSPEAKARLISFMNNEITVEFSGSFCYTCGQEAYFEDFIYELKRLDNDFAIDIKSVKQTGPETFEVLYAVKD